MVLQRGQRRVDLRLCTAKRQGCRLIGASRDRGTPSQRHSQGTFGDGQRSGCKVPIGIVDTQTTDRQLSVFGHRLCTRNRVHWRRIGRRDEVEREVGDREGPQCHVAEGGNQRDLGCHHGAVTGASIKVVQIGRVIAVSGGATVIGEDVTFASIDGSREGGRACCSIQCIQQLGTVGCTLQCGISTGVNHQMKNITRTHVEIDSCAWCHLNHLHT